MAGSAGRGYVRSKNSNPFFDDDEDVDDETFLQKAPVTSSKSNAGGGFNLQGKFGSGSNSFQPLEEQSAEDRRQQLLMEKQRIEERTLQASGRAKGILDETEKIGVSTAEELIRQREQLERTGSRLDEMNNSLRSSEKHIQNIKSVFSSFKNYFSKPDPVAKNSNQESSVSSVGNSVGASSSNSNLAKIVEQSSSSPVSTSQHPGLRIRGLENDQFSHKPLSNVDEQLEQDLGDMSLSLSRLKGLAQGLSGELDDQNTLIDRLQTSTDKADWRIQRQNKDMERLLKK
nr:EOG090X0MTI [Eurycercus lamellatus]